MFERLPVVAVAGISVLIFALPDLVGAAESAAPADTTVHHQDEVVVTASRYSDDVHLSHTNLTRAEIRRNQTAMDVPMQLQDIPGVFAYSDAGNGIGYTYLKIRGFDQRRLGVLVNGIPFNDPESHEVWWVDLPDLLSSVEDIQVQRGITNGVGGITAIGGSVNIVTDVLAEHPEGRATIEAGSYGTNRRSLKYATGDLGSGFATGLRISQIESDGYRDRAGSDQWAVFWSGRWRNEHHQVQANFYTGQEVTQHAWDPAPESILAEDRTYNPEQYWNAIDNFRQPHYELHWEWDLAESLLLRNSFYYIHGEGYYENYKDGQGADMFSLDYYLPFDGGVGYTDTTETDLVRTKWVRKEQTGWVPSLMWEHAGGRMVIGGDWYTFHSNHWGDVLMAGPDAGGTATSPFDIPDGLKYHDFTGDKDAWSAYFSERWEFVRGLTLLADLQYQHREYVFLQNEVGNFRGDLRNAYSVTHDFFNPKGGLFWQVPGGDFGLYANVGLTQREPADSDYWGIWAGPDDLYQTPLFNDREVVTDGAGNTEYVRWSDAQIEPERVVNYEGGVSYRAGTVSATLNGYYMDFENEIVPAGYWDADNNRSARTNADRTVHKGLELGLRWHLARDHRLSLAASRSDDTFEDYVLVDADGTPTADLAGNPIPLAPGSLVSLTWSSTFGAISGDVRYRHVGKQYLDATGNEDRTIAAANTLDVSLFLDLGRALTPALDGMRAYVRVLNLLDEDYAAYGYYDEWAGENYLTPAALRNVLVGVNYDF